MLKQKNCPNFNLKTFVLSAIHRTTNWILELGAAIHWPLNALSRYTSVFLALATFCILETSDHIAYHSRVLLNG